MSTAVLKAKWREPMCAAYGRLGPKYPRLVLALLFQAAHVVTLGGVWLLTLYQPVDHGDLIRLILVTQALVAFENVFALREAFGLLRPADPWLHGERNPTTAMAAWRALSGLPRDFLRTRPLVALFFNLLPVSAYITAELDLRWPAFFVIVAGASVVLLYGILVRFFVTELAIRPVVEAISLDLPDEDVLDTKSVSLRKKLLVALPAINVITGVTVSGLATRGHASLSDLGLSVLIALGVAFTISLELTLLLTRSLLTPIDALRRATERVKQGDLSTRVPVTAMDETGQLASSFNRMVLGLAEREKLHEAFGTYVDPGLAERVLAEGTALAGEEVEVSVVFVDIREFTAFAERAQATEVVEKLNEFFEHIVPVLVRNGGHANKFVGDGLLGVFGAPESLPDHADRAVCAALEIAELVKEKYAGELRIGIGVNSGKVIAGTVGGGGHLEFTVIGDVVNTASRVETATRETGDDILITEATRELLTKDFEAFERRPTIALKGKTETVRLFAPVATAEERRARLRAV
jgi:adenylate cyclase